MAANSGDESGSKAPALLERSVPYDQQAVVQLKEVQEGLFYDWGSLPAPQVARRLALVYAVNFAVGCAVASNTYELPKEALGLVLAANTGGLLMTLLVAVRIYSGWNYVSERLGLEVLDYEESSWADGFVARKPEEIRARDQYLNEFTVKPVLAKLRPIVGSVAAAFVASAVLFKVFGASAEEELYQPAYLSRLSTDDKAAAAAAEKAAQSGKPAYCGDRYFKVIAGGSNC